MLEPLNWEMVLDELKQRISYDYSISDLAAEAKISCSHCSEILSGKKRPSTEILKRLGYEICYFRSAKKQRKKK